MATVSFFKIHIKNPKNLLNVLKKIPIQMLHSMTVFSKKILLIFALILHAALLFATDQIPDLIICNGKTLYVSGTSDEGFPLFPILQDETYNSKMEKHEYGTLKLSSCRSSACYRGYQAIWELHNGIIYLKEVLDCCTQEPILDLKKIFGEKNVTKKGVRAFWINEPFYISAQPINGFTIGDNIKTINLNIEKGRIAKKE
jgi:hypothetical protein